MSVDAYCSTCGHKNILHGDRAGGVVCMGGADYPHHCDCAGLAML